jgi:hypothetical protein
VRGGEWGGEGAMKGVKGVKGGIERELYRWRPSLEPRARIDTKEEEEGVGRSDGGDARRKNLSC